MDMKSIFKITRFMSIIPMGIMAQEKLTIKTQRIFCLSIIYLQTIPIPPRRFMPLNLICFLVFHFNRTTYLSAFFQKISIYYLPTDFIPPTTYTNAILPILFKSSVLPPVTVQYFENKIYLLPSRSLGTCTKILIFVAMNKHTFPATLKRGF